MPNAVIKKYDKFSGYNAMHNLFHLSSQTIYEEGGCHHGVFGISVASGSRRECSVSVIKVAKKGSPPQPGISDGLPYLHAGPKKHLTKHCQRHNGPRLDFVSRFIFRACFHLVRNLANLAIRLRNLYWLQVALLELPHCTVWDCPVGIII